MKSILNFIRSTLTRDAIFLLPVVLLIMLFSTTYDLLLKLIVPFAEKLSEIIFGLDGRRFITIL